MERTVFLKHRSENNFVFRSLKLIYRTLIAKMLKLLHQCHQFKLLHNYFDDL